MTYLTLHPKVKAAALMMVAVDLATLAAWLNGTMSGRACLSAVVAGAATSLTGYLKSA